MAKSEALDAGTSRAPKGGDRHAEAITPTHRKAARGRKRVGVTPPGALAWSTTDERAQAMRAWRHAVGRRWAEHPRVLRVAWEIYALMGGGYCYASNAHLASETGINVENVERALKILDEGGAIIRTRVGSRRYIFPSTALLPVTMTGQLPVTMTGQLPVTMTGRKEREREHRRCSLSQKESSSGNAWECDSSNDDDWPFGDESDFAGLLAEAEKEEGASGGADNPSCDKAQYVLVDGRPVRVEADDTVVVDGECIPAFMFRPAAGRHR